MNNLLMLVSIALAAISIKDIAEAANTNDSKWNTTINGDQFTRNLQETWSDFSSWDPCNSRSSCTWLDNQCSVDPGDSLKYETFDENESLNYCVNSVADSSIVIYEEVENSVMLSHNTGAGATTDSICEWSMVMNSLHPVNIDLWRSGDKGVDLYFYILGEGNTFSELTSKDLQTCDNTYTLSLSKIRYIRVKAKMLNSNAAYSIKVHQDIPDLSIGLLNYIVSAIVVVLIVLMLFGFLVMVWMVIRECFKKRQQRHEVYEVTQQEAVQKIRIEETMENMKNGKFSENLCIYDEDRWVICLEKFVHDSKVHITNEWNHVFHSECLDQWYQTLALSRPLNCPHWHTANTPIKSTVVTRNSNNPILESKTYNADLSSESHLSQFSIPPIHNVTWMRNNVDGRLFLN